MSIKPAIPDDVKDVRFWTSVRDTLLILLGRRGNRIAKLATVKRVNAFKAGSFTRDLTAASGSQSVTGVGFKPGAVLCIASISGGSGATGGSVGFYGPTTNMALEALFSATATFFQANTLGVIRTATGDLQTFTMSSLDSDGFTVSWTKVGSPTGTGTVGYLVFADPDPIASDLVEGRMKVNEILEELHGPYL